eukprot:8788897-Lingulodinium_polyedra.AAC.1
MQLTLSAIHIRNDEFQGFVGAGDRAACINHSTQLPGVCPAPEHNSSSALPTTTCPRNCAWFSTAR